MAHILISDDDGTQCELVKRSLESDGHSVAVVGDGGAALSHIKSGATVDVLVADIDMPVLDGIALAQQALAVVPTLCILMISGLAERLEDAKKISAPRLSTLQKPFSLEAVRAEVKALLG